MDEKTYRRELWIYSVLVVVASIFAVGLSVVSSWVNLNPTLSWIFSVLAIVLFLFATVRFALFLHLKPKQWVAAILLLLLAWVGSVIYLVTRKPGQPPAGTAK